jgi:hypothetical protein
MHVKCGEVDSKIDSSSFHRQVWDGEINWVRTPSLCGCDVGLSEGGIMECRYFEMRRE